MDEHNGFDYRSENELTDQEIAQGIDAGTLVLWRTTDAGVRWFKVVTFPEIRSVDSGEYK